MLRRRPLARMAVRTTVVAGTAAAVGAHSANKAAAANAEAAAQAAPEPAPVAAEAPAPPVPEAAAPAAPDPIAQLTQLAALKESGVVTEAEFEAQKARILA